MKSDIGNDLLSGCRNVASDRSRLYGFLGIAYHLPSEDVVGILKGSSGREIVDNIGEIYLVTPDFGKVLDELRETMASLDGLLELQVEYTRLFIGPFHIPASPYESVYRPGSGGRVMGESTIKVREMYLSEGLDLSGSVRDLPDHLIAEMEFMSYLAGQEALSWGKDPARTLSCLRKQEAFIDEHLQQWIPKFSAAVCNNARSEFYRLIAEITRRIVSLDSDYVKAVRISMERGDI